MRIQLPVETWIEILDWLNRRDLIKKIDQLWDSQFTLIVQDWLHKYTRNVKIGHLLANADGLSVRLCKNSRDWEKVPFADVELPENIISFEWITIRCLDSTVLAFLRQMRPLFHKISLRLIIDAKPEIQSALRFLTPMINSDGSIESIVLDCKRLQFFFANHPSSLLNAKVLQIWKYQKPVKSKQILIDWLFTKREDGHARILIICRSSANIYGLCGKIRERFLDPTRQSASPFFIRIRDDYDLELKPPNAWAIENVQTGEQLTVNYVFPSKLISNCAPNVDPEWLAKKQEKVLGWNFSKQQQVICLHSPGLDDLMMTDDDAEEEAL